MHELERCSDEELAVRAADSEQAEGVLLSRYLRLIRFHAVKLAPTPTDAEDLVQEGMIALVHAVKVFDAAQGKAFGAFAQACILNAMRSFLRKERRAAYPVEDLVGVLELRGDLVDPDTPESILTQKDSLAQCRMQVMAMLSKREWEILQCLLEGNSYEECARKLAVSPKSVDNAVQRIRRKMRAVRSTDYFDSI